MFRGNAGPLDFAGAQISEIFANGGRKVPCVWFSQVGRNFGVSLPGKLSVLVRGDFQSASWKTAQDSTYE